MKTEKHYYTVPWEDMIDWSKIPKDQHPKDLCIECEQKKISDPIWDFCSMDCYYQNWLKKNVGIIS